MIKKEYKKDYESWNKIKQQVDLKKVFFEFDEREIWWSNIGVNIGEEIDGKNSNFERPVLVFKKFSKENLFVFPITGSTREGSYFCNLEMNNEVRSVCLHQGRFISRKRLLRRIETLSDDKFSQVAQSFKKLFKIESPSFDGLSQAPYGEDVYSIAEAKNLSTLSQVKRRTAEKILQEYNILDLLKQFGVPRIGGSYYTNLMTMPNDIDITVVSNNKSKSTIDFVKYILEKRLFQKFEFGDFEKFKRENRPQDYIVVLKFEYNKEKWEIEIWFKESIDNNMIELEEKLLELPENIRMKILLEKFIRDKNSDKKKQASIEIYKKYINL